MNARTALQPSGTRVLDAVHAGWLKPLRGWPQAILQALRREAVIVRVVLATVRGSAPREVGVVMLVGHEGTQGTIGGGQLEWEAVAAARRLLAEPQALGRLHRWVLATDLEQCCGGVVEVWLERYTRAQVGLLRELQRAVDRGVVVLQSSMTPTSMRRTLIRGCGANSEADALLRMPRATAIPQLHHGEGEQVTLWERVDEHLPTLWLFGAGHVGQALARIMMELPFRLTWLDARAELFPTELPPVIEVLRPTDPVASVARAPSGTRFIIMTHSHPLDYALCHAILRRDDVSWVGLIGSHSKAARFRSRLARDGLTIESISRLQCPIGVEGILSKWPSAIAVGIAAQLMQTLEAKPLDSPVTPNPGPVVTSCADAGCSGCREHSAPTT